MTKYTCFVCRKEHEMEGNMLQELDEGEVMLCPSCADVVQRLTGQEGREVETDD